MVKNLKMNGKSVLAVGLAIVMVLSTFSMAFANDAGSEDWDNVVLPFTVEYRGNDFKGLPEVKSEVKDVVIPYSRLLYQMAIMEQWQTNEVMKREDITALVMKALGYSDLICEGIISQKNLESKFGDVSGWSEPYITVAAAKGIVGGVSEGKFLPKGDMREIDFLYLLARTHASVQGITDLKGVKMQLPKGAKNYEEAVIINSGLAKKLPSKDVKLTRQKAAEYIVKLLTSDHMRLELIGVNTGENKMELVRMGLDKNFKSKDLGKVAREKYVAMVPVDKTIDRNKYDVLAFVGSLTEMQSAIYDESHGATITSHMANIRRGGILVGEVGKYSYKNSGLSGMFVWGYNEAVAKAGPDGVKAGDMLSNKASATDGFPNWLNRFARGDMAAVERMFPGQPLDK